MTRREGGGGGGRPAVDRWMEWRGTVLSAGYHRAKELGSDPASVLLNKKKEY